MIWFTYYLITDFCDYCVRNKLTVVAMIYALSLTAFTVVKYLDTPAMTGNMIEESLSTDKVMKQSPTAQPLKRVVAILT
jgi:hypothetical protein